MEYPSINILQGLLYQLQNEDGTPRFLYHYTKFENAIKILASGQLFMRSLDKQNDPWEFYTREDTGVMGTGEPIEETYQNLIKHNQAIAERKNAVRLTSFSIDAKDKYSCRHGWNLFRMWAQYADNHAGICLIFNYKQLCNDFNAAFADGTTLQIERPIKYVNLSELDEINEMFWKPIATVLDEGHIDHLFTKPADFEHEQEYRFLIANKKLNNSNENLYIPIKNSICGIITGRKFGCDDDANMKHLRMEYLRNAMDLCNKNMRLFNMLSYSFSEPLHDSAASQEWTKRVLGDDFDEH